MEDLGLASCSTHKTGKASARDVALKLGSYFGTHCTVTGLEGVMGEWIM